MNSVFRVYRYPPDYAAFIGKDLTPQGPIECFPTGIDPMQTRSTGFELDQNFPNPVNSTTVIKFRLFEQDQTILTVYDAYGRKVSVLLNEILCPGSYQINFDTDHLPSGIYFYTLTAGGKAETKALAVLKGE